MAIATIRHVLKLGHSLIITFPAEWTKGKVKAGDEVAVIGTDNELRILLLHNSTGKEVE